MLSSTALYRASLPYPHQRKVLVDVITARGVYLLRDVPVSEGTVSASLTNRVTRSCDLTLADDQAETLFPDLDTDPLSPTRGVLIVRAGVQFADGSFEVFHVFVGRVITAALSPEGTVSIQADDLASDVAEFRFETPRRADRPTIIGQIERLVAEAVPGVVFGTHNVDDAVTPELTWDEDRGQAVDDLAETLGARWYFLGDGRLVIRAFPYDIGTPVTTLSDGELGLIGGATISKTRQGVANSVTVVSERVDGTDPVRVTARNITVGSPTEYGDTFGRVSQIIKIQTPVSNAEAQRLARAQLNGATALTEQWSITCVPDYTLEPGDTVRLKYRGRTVIQVIDQITYPLGLEAMKISTRAFSVPPVSLGS